MRQHCDARPRADAWALQTLELEDKTRIMEQLLESTLDLVADQNGNHVIQKCIECIKPTIHIEPLIGVRPPPPPPSCARTRRPSVASSLLFHCCPFRATLSLHSALSWLSAGA